MSHLSLRTQLLGAWELVDYSATLVSDGSNIIYPMGSNASGLLLYTSDGYMSAQLQAPGQQPYAANNMHRGTDAEYIESAKRYLAYTGPFYVDEAGEGEGVVLKHSMRNCSYPNWLGIHRGGFVSLRRRMGRGSWFWGVKGLLRWMGRRGL